MDTENDKSYLRRRVEACFGTIPATSRHFEQLSESIHSRTGVLLSPTTLKRFWGYLSEPVVPSRHTLDVLCRYAGWKDWQDFSAAPKSDALESGPVGSPSLDVRRDLQPGCTVLLTWAPGRICRIRSLGADSFEVVESQGSRLQPGDRFRTARIIADAPLYLDHLTRDADDMGTYVCGSKTGVRFVLENPEQS